MIGTKRPTHALVAGRAQRKLRLGWASTAVVVLIAGGCGGDSGSKAAAKTSTSASEASTTAPAGDGAAVTDPAGTDTSATMAPTTASSTATTIAPSTIAPSTIAPSTIAPTTMAPTTVVPTSAVELKYTFPVGSSRASFEHAHHDYPAADIFAPCGSPVLAPMSGVVQDVSTVDEWDSATDEPSIRGGLSVSIVGDDGVRYYGSHLKALDPATVPGARVTSGQQLGTVGDTGNAAGTGCHLHFGISPPCGPGDWEVRRGVLKPWDYLEDWRDGGQSSPTAAITAIGCK